MLRFVLVTVVLSLAALPVGGAPPPTGAEECPPGTLPFPRAVQCAPVVDQTGRQWSPASYPEHTPSPGYPAGELKYKDGYLDPSEGAELYTGVIVYPNGLGSGLGTSWGWRDWDGDGVDEWTQLTNSLHVTAVNRSQKSMEISTYYERAEGAALILFDWSCSLEYPCYEVGNHEEHTAPWFVLSTKLGDNPCYVDKMTNSVSTNGDWHHMLYYRNLTAKLDGANPPLWRNSAMIANYCTYAWDTVYAHEYRVVQDNCALAPVPSGCHQWAAILEYDPQEWSPGTSPVSKLGFADEQLLLAKPGEPSGPLTPEHTEWIEAPAGWQGVSYMRPNHSWGRGTYLDSDVDGVWDQLDPDDDDDGASDVNEAGAPLCAGSKNDDFFDDDPENPRFNDGCPAVGSAETACSDSSDEDGDGYINDGCPQVGDYSEAQFKVGTNSLGTCFSGGSYPNPQWPADIADAGGYSRDKVNISDIGAYYGVPRMYGTSPSSPAYDPRFDVVPGTGPVPGEWINIADIQYIAFATAPMLGGARMFGGPPCPW